MSDQLSSELAALRLDRSAAPSKPQVPRGPSKIGRALVMLLVVGACAAGAAVAYPLVRAEIYKTHVSATEVRMISPSQASVTVSSSGYVLAQRTAKVGAKVPGRVARVLVKQGQRVEEKAPLFELETAEHASTIAAAQARWNAARARASAARASMREVAQQVERERKLVQKGVVGAAQLEDLDARLNSLRLTAEAAEAEAFAAAAEVQVLKVSMTERTVVAPMAGTVMSEPPAVGEMVGPQSADAVELADLNTMVVETDVPEVRLASIKVGTPCEIALDAYPDRRFRGRASQLGTSVNRAKATVAVRVEFIDASEGVLPGMAARISFLAAEQSSADVTAAAKRVVSSTAVLEREGAKVLLVIEDGVARDVPVVLAGQVGDDVELVQGPAPGTRVVASPPTTLRSGQRVKVSEE